MRQARYTSQSIDRMRQQIADAATSAMAQSHTATNLNDMVVQLAKLEGYDFAYRTAEMALNHEKGGPQAALDELFDLLQHGPDDGWSGRGNDVKRARFDGIREAVRDLRYSLEHEALEARGEKS